MKPAISIFKVMFFFLQFKPFYCFVTPKQYIQRS